jgi:2-dehydro-3-deoxygalactonokinase
MAHISESIDTDRTAGGEAVHSNVSPAWVGVDWGTSNLRIRIMDADNRPVHTIDSSAGMASLLPDQFEPTLIGLLAPYLQSGRVLPVVCCGMVGARQGWSDAGYLTTPVDPARQAQAHRVKARDNRIAVVILPGVQQLTPADVMRGEETQIAGFLHHRTDFDGALCLPGTHTKWVQVEAACIVRFLTCMSGELFALLSTQSVLRHSMRESEWSDEAFAAAVDVSLANPENLVRLLFSLRAENLVNSVPGSVIRARLSGLLIGAELAATREYWSNNAVTIIGEPALTVLYRTALSRAGIVANVENGNAMTLSGLIASHLQETNSCLETTT